VRIGREQLRPYETVELCSVVYAGGDMTHPMQHIFFAVSRGALAAVGINRALLQEDFR
jgi:hypothetical protein